MEIIKLYSFICSFSCLVSLLFSVLLYYASVKKDRELDVSQQGQRSLKDLPESKIVDILNSRSHKVSTHPFFLSFIHLLLFCYACSEGGRSRPNPAGLSGPCPPKCPPSCETSYAGGASLLSPWPAGPAAPEPPPEIFHKCPKRGRYGISLTLNISLRINCSL